MLEASLGSARRAGTLILNGFTASPTGFGRSGRDLVLVIAPKTAGGTDGGTIKLLHVGSDGTPGSESRVLAGVAQGFAVPAGQRERDNDALAAGPNRPIRVHADPGRKTNGRLLFRRCSRAAAGLPAPGDARELPFFCLISIN
jgi:hypothetical protein